MLSISTFHEIVVYKQKSGIYKDLSKVHISPILEIVIKLFFSTTIRNNSCYCITLNESIQVILIMVMLFANKLIKT